MRKKNLFSKVSFFLIFLVTLDSLANLQNADSKFKSKLYNEAAKLYEEETKKENFKSLAVEAKEEVILKLTQSQILANTFEKALLHISSLKITDKSKNYPFYLLLKSKAFEKYLQNYRYQMQSLDVEGESDILKKSPAYFESQIRELTQALWQNRLEYLNIVLTENLYLFDMSSADQELIPTFYDYLITQFQANYQWQGVKDFSIDKMLKEASEVEVKYPSTKSLAAQFSPSEITKKRAYIREKWLIELKKREWQILQYVGYDFNYTETKEEKEAIEKNKDLTEKMNIFLGQLKTSRAKSEWYVLLAKNELKNKEFEKSYSDCEKAIDLYKSQISAECFEIQRSIVNKEMYFNHGLFDSEQEIEVPLKVRNFDKIYVRLYEVPFDGNWEKFLSDFKSSLNTYLDNERIKKWLMEKPIFESEVSADIKRKYTQGEALIKIAKRPAGRYVILISESKDFEFEKKFIAGTFVLVSDLVMLTQTGVEFNPEKSLAVKEITHLPTQHFYYFNSITGKLEKNVNLLYSLNYKANQLVSDQNEKTTISDDWDFTGQQRLNYGHQIYAVGYKGRSFSFLNQYINKTHQQKVELLIEKDRPIYRPGQKIKFKVIALQRVPFGWQVMPLRKITVNIKDANYKQAHTVELTLNEMGSANSEFEIPKTALLGNYHIEAIIQDQGLNLTNVTKNFTEYFKVEEYKRPEFFVEIPKSESPWVFNKKTKMVIRAKYYHGSPVKAAAVNYTVNMQTYWPWFYRPWFYDQNLNATQDAGQNISGSGITNDKGELEVEYTPQSKSEAPMQFSVKADIRDSGGRTISGSQSFYASKSEYVIQLSQEKNFFFVGESPKYTVDLKDLNERKYSGEVNFTLSEVLPPTSEQLKNLKDKEKSPTGAPNYPFYPQHRRGYYPSYIPEHDINFYLKDLTKKEIEKKTLKVATEKSLSAEFSKLKEGFYHIKAESFDSQKVSTTNEIYFMVYQSGEIISQYYLPKITLQEKKTYQVGDKVKVVFGSSQLMADAVVNVLRMQFLGPNKIYKDKVKFRLFEFKAEEQFQRNVTLTWFGWGEKKVIQGSEIIEIQPYNKKLDLALDYKKELKPSEKQIVKFKVENAAANLEGLLKVYDQSLEYYSKDSKDRFMELYSADESSQSVYAFEFSPQTSPVPEKINIFGAMIELFKRNMNLKRPPRLNIDFDQYVYRGQGGDFAANALEMNSMVSAKGMMPQSIGSLESDAVAPAMMAGSGAHKSKMQDKAAERKEEALTKKSDISTKDKADDGTANVQVRSDFSETAVFSPQIEFKGKNASVEFKLPDQLTTWKLESLVVGKNGTLGQESGSFVTNKSLMAKLQLPRFFREKDQSEIRVFVENKSKKDLSGFVKLSLEQQGKEVLNAYTKDSSKQSWNLKAGGQISLVWKVLVPSQLSDLKIKAVGMAGQESDAEEKIIPVLPSRERLIETQMAFVEEKKKTKLSLPKWNEKDETRLNEQIVVQLDPQLPLMLLNSIPSLINYPYNCSEQLINKFVPLAIINSLYEKNPKLKESLKKVPLRTTINLPWEDKDPRRLISLMETPWKQISEGFTSPWDLIQLTDAEQVEKIKRYVFTELQNRQLTSGGFTWFSGGKEDLYITLVILEGFSEALKYGVDIPKDMISKALNYVYSELPKHLKAEQSELQFLIFGSYVFSSFDEVGLKLSRNKEALSSWVPFIEKHEHLITQFGHAYMANIYQRTNQKEKMEKALKRAFDGMKTDDLVGSYWTPEDKSWIWYNDSVEKHAFFIQTLVELKPKDERINSLVKWLLFNRKGNEWKSTKTSAKAIYSIIRFMKNKGALDKSTLIDVKWGDLSHKIEIDPFEFKKEPLRFVKTENFKANDGSVEFKKSGALPVIVSSTWIYTTDKINTASSSSMLSLDRQFYKVKSSEGKQSLVPLKSEDKIKVGDEVEVQLRIKAKSQLEYVHLKDPRGAGFEANQLLSGYVWDLLARYEEPRDSLTNFFISWLPQGEYILKHRFKSTTKGKYKFGSAVIQSMYSPDMSAYSSGMILEVE